MGYAKALAHYPYVVIVVVLLCATTCLIVTITLGELPDFSDPKAGFEPRGTVISSRINAREKLLDKTWTIWTSETFTYKTAQFDRHKPSLVTHDNYTEEPPSGEDEDYSFNMTLGYFCGQPRKEYARLVFEATDHQNLFTIQNIHSMCAIENIHIRTQPAFTSACELSHSQCCRSWSLGNYIALLTNKSSCTEIKQHDVQYVLDLLTSCMPFYQNKSLGPDCDHSSDPDYSIYSETSSDPWCEHVPPNCAKHNVVYHLLHYILDISFQTSTPKSQGEHKLTWAITFLPIAASTRTLDLYRGFTKIKDNHHGDVSVVAINFGVKESLFDEHLLRDSIWIGVALIAIFLCMWLYSGSLCITMMALLAIAMALIISYFLYNIVFEIKFFPFMNMLTVVILIGIGADDVFIYCRTWRRSKLEKNHGTLEKLISDSLKHASLSMFVTSCTTAAAFFANYVSNITALKCFSIFAGTAVIVNFILMVTWIPAVVVVHEKWCSSCVMCFSKDFYPEESGVSYILCRLPNHVYQAMLDFTRSLFDKCMPCIVVKLRYLWLTLFVVVGVGAFLVTVYWPKLRLPTSNAFKLFAPHHPVEVYDHIMKDHFQFEKAAGSQFASLPLTIIWGVSPMDNGNFLDPSNTGTLVMDPTFNMATKDAQRWLLKFCAKLRTARYFQMMPGIQLSNCFIENFRLFMKRRCRGPNNENYRPCCKQSKFPYKENVFRKCLREFVPELEKSRYLYNANRYAGPRYFKKHDSPVALLVDFNSNQSFTFNYTSMGRFYNHMEKWVKKELLLAPEEMQNAWFISDLGFYDLQHSIAHGTLVSVAVSIGVAAVVAFFTTLNILVTLYAILTITFIIFSTVASLVLLGWELNILESVSITVAVGLSIDFTLHMGVAYRLAPDLDREARITSSLSKMGAPVSMAALTTFLAGLCMMPSTVLAYQQLGIFLMLIMAASWLYATFFYLSVLCSFGPRGGFGQFHWPSCHCCCSYDHSHVDKTVYSMSESTLSSSSTNHGMTSETHELEPLAEKEADHHYNHRHKHLRTRLHGHLISGDTTPLKHHRAPPNLYCPIGPTTNGAPHRTGAKDQHHKDELAPLKQEHKEDLVL